MNQKSNLRKLLDWEEEVIFSRKGINSDETKSIDHCETRYYNNYKYNIFYEVGKDYTFNKTNLVKENTFYAVSNIF